MEAPSARRQQGFADGLGQRGVGVDEARRLGRERFPSNCVHELVDQLPGMGPGDGSTEHRAPLLPDHFDHPLVLAGDDGQVPERLRGCCARLWAAPD